MFRLPRRIYLANHSKIVRELTVSTKLLGSDENNKIQKVSSADKKASFRRILTEMDCVKKRMAAAFGLSVISSGVMMGRVQNPQSCGTGSVQSEPRFNSLF